jgi:hypothetical protein
LLAWVRFPPDVAFFCFSRVLVGSDFFSSQNMFDPTFRTTPILLPWLATSAIAILGQKQTLQQSTFFIVTRERERLSENDRRTFLNIFPSSTKCLSEARAESRWLARSSKKRSKKMRRWGIFRFAFALIGRKGARASASERAPPKKKIGLQARKYPTIETD